MTRSPSLARCVALALALTACSLDRGGLLPSDGGPVPADARVDGATPNDAEIDGGADADLPDSDVPDACSPTEPLVCDGEDQDCDGTVDEGCDRCLGVTCGPLQECSEGVCVAHPDRPVEVGAGFDFTCARTLHGRIYCWGANGNGQLGDGSTTAKSSPQLVPTLTDAVDLDVGRGHACAIITDGSLWCWGRNNRTQVAVADMSNQPTPVRVGTGSFRAVSAGYEHTCGITPDDAVWCWGATDDGRLGVDAPVANQPVPQQVTRLGGAASVGLGWHHSCAVTASRQVACWGRNEQGQLGSGDTAARSSPQSILTQADDERGLAVDGGDRFTCALTERRVLCWGLNTQSQLAAPNPPANRSTPDAVGGFGAVTQLAVGSAHACVLAEDQRLWCWGNGANGRLGLGNSEVTPIPAQVAALSEVTDVSAGHEHTCAIAGGDVYCWGNGANGRLGLGSTTSYATPQRVSVPLDDAAP